jgi:hypothetical protein
MSNALVLVEYDTKVFGHYDAKSYAKWLYVLFTLGFVDMLKKIYCVCYLFSVTINMNMNMNFTSY